MKIKKTTLRRPENKKVQVKLETLRKLTNEELKLAGAGGFTGGSLSCVINAL